MMNKSQRIWLYFIAGFSVVHLTRDVMQDMGVKMWLTTILASPGPPKIHLALYWTIFNTYAFAIIQIVVAAKCLRSNTFGRWGKWSVVLAIFGLVVWIVYYYLL